MLEMALRLYELRLRVYLTMGNWVPRFCFHHVSCVTAAEVAVTVEKSMKKNSCVARFSPCLRLFELIVCRIS